MRARILSIVLPVILIVGASIVSAAPAQAATGDAASVFTQTNAQRTKAGLRPLISDPALDRAAQAWAQQLASTCTFAHSTSAWRTGRVASSGWSATGENIAAGYAANAVVSAWMASSGHRANILNSRYTGVGIGFAKGTCYSSYWVQIFGLSKTATTAGAGDLNGDLAGDVVATDSDGQLVVYRGSGSAGWKGTAVAGTGWQPDDKLVTLGDFSGDGIADVGRIRADGTLELLRGTGGGGFATPTAIGSGWSAFSKVIGGMDFNGDRRTDVLAVKPSGALMLYRGSGSGWWSGGPTQIGNGWHVMTSIMYGGDFDGDTHGDLIARRSDGTLWLYRTTGGGAWNGTKQIGNGWNVMTSVFSPGDFDGNGKPDVLARKSDGSLLLYRGNGKGGWGTISVVGNGWNVMTQIG
ncbi:MULTISPECIES: FG-GAP-like repeat-containing protein [Microbacterium]|uniref:FG-GAP-like repeat-containing protein n=1 Tax=Microbacterium TaxID=33882 RepID=UPI00146E4386|nr:MULTISPECIES: FG-GAP-like repeat-containing protein [Microbacterium]